MWQDKHTQKKHKRKHKWIYTQWNGPSETKPNPQNCNNCSSKCAYDCTTSVHNTAQNSSDNQPSYFQTTVNWSVGHAYVTVNCSLTYFFKDSAFALQKNIVNMLPYIYGADHAHNRKLKFHLFQPLTALCTSFRPFLQRLHLSWLQPWLMVMHYFIQWLLMVSDEHYFLTWWFI